MTYPVAAQRRFRHPQKTEPNWSAWQPASIDLNHPSWSIDDLGRELEYRLLYATCQQPVPEKMPAAPYQSIDMRSPNYSAGWNACRSAMIAAVPQAVEPDWSTSRTGLLQLWKCPMHPLGERLQIADGAVAFRDEVIQNLRARLEAPHVEQPVKPVKPVFFINNETLATACSNFGRYYLSPVRSDEEDTPLYSSPPIPDVSEVVEQIAEFIEKQTGGPFGPKVIALAVRAAYKFGDIGAKV